MNCPTCDYEFDPTTGLSCPRCGTTVDCTAVDCESCEACSGGLTSLGRRLGLVDEESAPTE